MLYDDEHDHPGVDQSVVHRDVHAAQVRVVPTELVAHAKEELEMLFPHETVLSTPMGCCHTCLYTATASAAVIAERISEHLREVEHREMKI